MSGSRSKRERSEPYSKPQKTPSRPYQSVRDASTHRREERAADKAFHDSIPPLIHNIRAMAGLPPARRPQ